MSVDGPADATCRQMGDVLDAMVRNEPLPPGFTLVDEGGRVTGGFVGSVSLVGQQRLVFTLIDDSSDVEVARLYVDKVLVQTATRQNGAITDRDGFATATMTTLAFPSLTSSVKVEWESATGLAGSVETEF